MIITFFEISGKHVQTINFLHSLCFEHFFVSKLFFAHLVFSGWRLPLRTSPPWRDMVFCGKPHPALGGGCQVKNSAPPDVQNNPKSRPRRSKMTSGAPGTPKVTNWAKCDQVVSLDR